MYEIRTSKKLKVPAADLATQIWEACKRTLTILSERSFSDRCLFLCSFDQLKIELVKFYLSIFQCHIFARDLSVLTCSTQN